MLNIFLSSCFHLGLSSRPTNFRTLITQSTGRPVAEAESPLFCIPALLFLQRETPHKANINTKRMYNMG